jgi:hypothetical protein
MLKYQWENFINFRKNIPLHIKYRIIFNYENNYYIFKNQLWFQRRLFILNQSKYHNYRK